MPSRYETDEEVVPDWLGKDLKLPHSGLVVKNRFYKGPMSEYIAVADKENLKASGVPTAVFANMNEKWAAGGFGMIVTGTILLDETGLARIPGNLLINPEADTPERRAGFKAIADAVKKHGSLMIGRLMNGGEQQSFLKSIGEEVTKSAFHKTKYGIKYLYDSGFSGASYQLVAIPTIEDGKRPDLAKLFTLIDALVEAKRSTIPEDSSFSLGIKLSTAKFQPFGVTFEDFVKIAQKLESCPFDYIELAGGNYEHPYENARERETFFQKIVDEIKDHVKSIPIIVIGGFRTVKVMERLLKEGKVDGIGLARPAAAEFDFPQKVLNGQVQATKWNPFEQDMAMSVLAGAAQMNQAGLRSLEENNGQPNFGVMDLSDEKVLEKFMAAKNDFVEKAEELRKQGKLAWGAVVIANGMNV
ncbi:NADH-dependent flavin oxidoreductase nadA [Ditylenchus destructor]|uniref:NADH-dependent flavin oxidoreductase nadA n=1 Tax=Ditylenchus destructor TaxID=166010 RepID=A0AAD4QYB5_9BILA|nr:NADH-dependent flavin oxidoreductase nadA [Ditylenchus destructor]